MQIPLMARELAATKEAFRLVQESGMARTLVQAVEQAGGVQGASRSLLFEVRFAGELARHGVSFDYEWATGVGNSSVDFRVIAPHEWLVELVSIGESQAAKAATTSMTVGPATLSHMVLTSGGDDERQSVEGEMLLVEQKIGEKVFCGGRETKFPVPARGVRHAIVVDMRGYGGSDADDYRQIALGPVGLAQEAIHYWREEPIRGLFQAENPLRATPLMRERIHFLGFVEEENYQTGEIAARGRLLANPVLLRTPAEEMEGRSAYPLRHPLLGIHE